MCGAGGDGDVGHHRRVARATDAVRDASTWIPRLKRELSRVIVGHDHLLDRLLVHDRQQAGIWRPAVLLPIALVNIMLTAGIISIFGL